MGSPQAIELLFNRAKRLIGFRSVEPGKAHGVPIRKQGVSESYLVAGLTFTKEYNIEIGTARRYSAKMQGNMLIVDLNETSSDATGPRLRASSSAHDGEGEEQVTVQQTLPITTSNHETNTKSHSGTAKRTPQSDADKARNVLLNALKRLDSEGQEVNLEHFLKEVDSDVKGIADNSRQ